MRHTGLIAEEVEAIVKKTGYVFSGVDAPENENDPYGIRYAEFVVPLVKGMQELTARLEEHEQKIVEQEQKIDFLVNLRLVQKVKLKKVSASAIGLFCSKTIPIHLMLQQK